MKRLLIICVLVLMFFSVYAELTSTPPDTTKVGIVSHSATIQIISIIVAAVTTFIATMLGFKLSKFKKIIQLVKILFQDIEDSVIDNKISSAEVKKIIQDIINIKSLFK